MEREVFDCSQSYKMGNSGKTDCAKWSCSFAGNAVARPDHITVSELSAQDIIIVSFCFIVLLRRVLKMLEDLFGVVLASHMRWLFSSRRQMAH